VAPPRIITARSIGLAFANLFGELGPERNVTGHYSAGPRARDWREGVARARSFHEQHRNQGWGGIGYHYVIADDGALICARPTLLKGAHVGGFNSQNLGVNCPGTTGDKPTKRQRETYAWLLANAHTGALPRAHRTDVDLRDARLFGHKDWPGHASNGCPGKFHRMYLRGIPTPVDERAAPPPPEEDLVDVGAPLEEEAFEDAPPVGAEPDAGGEPVYPPCERQGEVEADYRHVSPDEAVEAERNAGAAEELPAEDPEFDEELDPEALGTES
jgi:hypothetical protein